MSLENAILAHAAALTELAAAIRSMSGGAIPLTIGTGESIKGTITNGDADVEKDVAKVEADAKAKAAAAKKAKADKAKKDAEDAAAASAASSQTAGADSSDDLDDGDGLDDDEPVPDFKTVVRPALLEAIKRTDKATVLALIKSYGVAKAEELDESVYVEIMAKAAKLGA